ncbi:MAG: CamS family sex pheromone protein [Thomasclavelia sp.]|jgi:protein involved in sex pheromone biosynthesis|nr:CamS family sex pheromone protein [Thomasclavelia sp.]
MKKVLTIITCLCLCLALSACSSSSSDNSKKSKSSTDSESLDSSFYKTVNLGSSANREDIYRSFYSNDDFVNIGRQLQLISRDKFAINDYYMSDGVKLTKTDYDNLLKRSSDKSKYPHSLQPSHGTTIENVTDPIMVSQICELDFYSKSGNDYTLKGMSFGIVIDPRDASNNVLSPKMSSSQAKSYGEKCIEKLYKYLQTKKTVKDVPYQICVYLANDDTENTYNGSYVCGAYCDGSVGSISDYNYKTYVFSSDEATTADEETASNFDVFKNNLKNEASEAIGVVGYGKYEDGSISSMDIQLTLNVKTYSEMTYLVSYAADQLDSQFSGFDIKVTVKYEDGICAVIIKNSGSDAQSFMLKE